MTIIPQFFIVFGLKRLFFTGALYLLGSTLSPLCATADSRALDFLAPTWNTLDAFVSVNNCIAAPSDSGVFGCSPAQLSFLKSSYFEAGGLVAGTESTLGIADTLRKKEVKVDDLSRLFASYNYSEMLVSSRVSYVTKHWTMGLRPVRLMGQFQIHNPNLPLASITYRDDLGLYGGAGFDLGFFDRQLVVSAGAQVTLVQRRETILEGTLVDFASRPTSETIYTQRLRGIFADTGGALEWKDKATVGVLFQDLGKFLSGKEVYRRYLFVNPNQIPRVTTALAFTPPLWIGKFQIGASLLTLLDDKNTLADQWFGTVSYYVGPLRLLSGFRPDLLRTGISMRYSRFEVSVAQEWINRVERGRESQPRFTLEIVAGL